MLLVYHNNLRRSLNVAGGVNRDTGQGMAGKSPAMLHVKWYGDEQTNRVIRNAQVSARNALLLEFAATIAATGVLE